MAVLQKLENMFFKLPLPGLASDVGCWSRVWKPPGRAIMHGTMEASNFCILAWGLWSGGVSGGALEIEFGVFQKAAPHPTSNANRGILHLQRPFSITGKSRRMLVSETSHRCLTPVSIFLVYKGPKMGLLRHSAKGNKLYSPHGPDPPNSRPIHACKHSNTWSSCMKMNEYQSFGMDNMFSCFTSRWSCSEYD
jgi:hypothetical protein